MSERPRETLADRIHCRAVKCVLQREALEQARAGRMHILDAMYECISAARPEFALLLVWRGTRNSFLRLNPRMYLALAFRRSALWCGVFLANRCLRIKL